MSPHDPPPAGYTCPLCGATSHHPQDVANRYCGACHQFADDGRTRGPRCIAACLPVDTSGLPALPPGMPAMVAMVDDTIRTCGRCGQEVWVGPRKLALADAGQAEVMCYLCALITAAGATVVNLDPGRVERPRRDVTP